MSDASRRSENAPGLLASCSGPTLSVTRYFNLLESGSNCPGAYHQLGAGNLYCAACPSGSLDPTPANWPATDFVCQFCGESYELKSGKTLPLTRIVDAAYSSMISAILSDRAPNLFYLHYHPLDGIQNLFLIPRFFFTEHCIESRKPLSATARRAGWIGCNIRVDLIAPEGRIEVVSKREVIEPGIVRAHFGKLATLRQIPPTARGWTLAVLLGLHALGKDSFNLEEAYSLAASLSAQFPKNNNVRPKIRQQLQVLRDLGLLIFVKPGTYRFR